MKFELVCCPLCGSDEAYPVLEWRARRMFRCRRCSLLYRNPRPIDSDVRRSYAEKCTIHEQEERVGERRTHQFRRFLDLYPDRPGRLLDVGCGHGFFLKMAEERGWEAVGVDVDSKSIAYANEHLRVNAILGDVRDVHFSDGSFDLITLWNVMECIPDPLDLLRRLCPILKEGGTVFLRTQNETWHRFSFRLTNFLAGLAWKSTIEKQPFATFMFHMVSFSHTTLRLLIEQAGLIPLSITNSKPTEGDPYLGLDSKTERMLTMIKLAVHGIAQGSYLVSGGRWLIGPSLEAWGRRGKTQGSIVAASDKKGRGMRDRRKSVHAA